jgi:uncharacterized protein (DUF2147 family)
MRSNPARILQIIFLVTTVMLCAPRIKAQSSYDTPVGRWRTVSDVTGKENGAVEIVDNGGELLGRLIAGRNPATFPTELCTKCPGDRHNKPMKGLLVMSGVRRNGDEWSGGEILDPDIGKIYRVKLRLTEGGKKLLVRGYIGFSLFGRTQTWTRME